MSSIFPITSDDGLFEYLPITSATLETGLEVLRKSFFVDEIVIVTVGASTNPEAAKELEELCVINAKDGVSVIAIEKSTGLAVGVIFNKLQVKDSKNDSFFEEFAANCKHSNSRAVVQFMIDADAKADLFDLCQVDCFLEMVFLAVLRSHRCRGIGLKLCEISIDIARSLFNRNNVKTAFNKDDVLPIGPIPKGVCAMFTSKKSQSLGRKLNLSIATEISYEKCTFEGKTFAERIGSDEAGTIVEYIKF